MFWPNFYVERKLRDLCMAFNILKAAKIMTVVLWERTPCIPVTSYQRSKKNLTKEAENSSVTLTSTH